MSRLDRIRERVDRWERDVAPDDVRLLLAVVEAAKELIETRRPDGTFKAQLTKRLHAALAALEGEE